MNRKFTFLLIVFLLTIIIRIPKIESDPPSIVASISGSASIFCDEGMYPHNARNKILFNKWVIDDWNPFIYNPILTILYYLTFLIFGVKILFVKLWNILFASISVLLFFHIANKKKINIWIISSISLLFSFNFYWINYSRVGLLENFSTLFFILSFVYFIKIEDNHKNAFLAGIFATIAILSKYLFAYFLLATFISILFYTLKKKNKKILLFFTGGVITTFLLWFFTIYLPNLKYFHKIGNAWSSQSIPHTTKRIFHNLINNSLPRYFSISPLIFYIGILFISLIIAKILLKIEIKADEVFLFLWISFSFFQIGILNYQPLRYYLPLIPALFLAFLYIFTNINSEQNRLKLSLLSMFLSVAVIFIFFRSFSKLLFKSPSAFFVYPFIFRLSLIIAILLFLYLFIGGINKFKIKKIFITILIFAFIFWGEILLQFRFGFQTKYNLKNINTYMEKTLNKDSFIVGQCALRAVFDTKLKAIPAYKGWFNDKNLFQRYPITNLLMLKRFNELSWIIHRYPQIKNGLELIKTFPIWDTKLIFYKLNKRKEER